MCRTSLLALSLALLSCSARHDEGFDAALARTRDRGALLLVHFRLPGRPLSDAMDAALATALPTELHGFEQVRLDAGAEIECYRRLVGASARAGAGLGTCVVDPDGAPLAVHTGYLSPDALTEFAASARSLRAELADSLRAIAAAPGDPLPRLLHAEVHLRLGRRSLAREKLRAVLDTAEEPWASRAAARLAAIAVDDGDIDAARDWLEQAAPSAELAAGLALTRGKLQLADCEPRRARATLEAAVTAHANAPESPALLLALGQARHEAGADADALETFTDIMTRLPGSPAATRAQELADHVRRGDLAHSHGEQSR